MAIYESMVIFSGRLEANEVDQEIEKVKTQIESGDGTLHLVERMGKRKLAYEIRKHKEGIYTLIRFNAGAGIPVELDRRYRLNENMLRFLTVVYERPPVGEGVPEGEEEAAASTPGAPAPEAPAAGAPAAATPVATDSTDASAPEAAAATPEPEPVPVAEATEATAGEETPEDAEKPSQE